MRERERERFVLYSIRKCSGKKGDGGKRDVGQDSGVELQKTEVVPWINGSGFLS